MAHVDLHLHSTASDGEHAPAEVARRAGAAGVSVISLTDHDTVDGVAEAAAAGRDEGVRVVSGCELSVAVPWGELHLLAYFVPLTDARLSRFLDEQCAMRTERGDEILRRLRTSNVRLVRADVDAIAAGAPVGRPHVARALVQSDQALDMQDAFDRYLGRGRPAFVPKRLPELHIVCGLIREIGGVTSAAHLGSRVTRRRVRALQRLGVDAIEVLHPSHDEDTSARLAAWAAELGMLRSGGSDWHGEGVSGVERKIGVPAVPATWLEELERAHAERVGVGKATA